MTAYTATSWSALAHSQQGVSGTPVPRALAAIEVDNRFGGSGTVSGVTERQTGPASFVAVGYAAVWVYDQATGIRVAVTTSGADGTYSVSGLNPGRTYYAIAWDPGGVYDLAATRNLPLTVT